MAGSSSSYIDMDIGMGEDVLMDILSRLPVKYVLRCRCVSKLWCALLETPYFIKKHLQRNHTTLIEGNAPLFCIDNQMIDDFETNSSRTFQKSIVSWIFSSDFINDDETTAAAAAAAAVVEVPSTDPNPFTDDKTISRGSIMGPVNGIFFTCAYHANCSRSLYLCNPSLRELKAIPSVPSLITECCSFGFGYDSKANDYKVLAIVFDWRVRRKHRSIYHVFLYSLRRNSWRKIECDDYMKSFSSRAWEPTFVNHGSRVAHWFIYDDGDENGEVILSFDFVNEEFQRSSLPEALKDKLRTSYGYLIEGRQMLRYDCQIGVLKDESIALIIRLHPLSSRRHKKNGYFWEVWVMKEYGVRESWTKLFATGYLPGLWSFLGFVNNEREILFRDDHHLVSYDPYRKKTKDFHLKSLWVNTYMESLVSIINIGDY